MLSMHVLQKLERKERGQHIGKHGCRSQHYCIQSAATLCQATDEQLAALHQTRTGGGAHQGTSCQYHITDHGFSN